MTGFLTVLNKCSSSHSVNVKRPLFVKSICKCNHMLCIASMYVVTYFVSVFHIMVSRMIDSQFVLSIVT